MFFEIMGVTLDGKIDSWFHCLRLYVHSACWQIETETMEEIEDASCSVANWNSFINHQLYSTNVLTVDSGYHSLREGLMYFHKTRPACQVVSFCYGMSCRGFRSFMDLIAIKWVGWQRWRIKRQIRRALLTSE